jgi:hypothetical protein
MRERQGDETATPERSSPADRSRRRWKRRRLVLAALAAILVGVVIGWLAYTVLAARAAPLSGSTGLGSPAGNGHDRPAIGTSDVANMAIWTPRAGPDFVSERDQKTPFAKRILLRRRA